MEVLIPFVLPIIVWVFIYKYLVNKKFIGKVKAHLLSFIVSSIVFIVSIILVSDSIKSNNTLKVENEIKKEQTIEVTPKVTQEQSTQINQDEAKKEVDEFIKNKVVEEPKKVIQSITSDNMKDVVKSLKKNYNIVATNWDKTKLSDEKICFTERGCEINANEIQIQGFGKFIEASTNSKVAPKEYLKVCNAIMIGLTDANKELIEQQMPQYFNYAATNGRSTWEALGIEVTIAPDSSNLLRCKFFKK